MEKVCLRPLTCMRHLLTSLAQSALLQPDVRDSPDRRKRRAAVMAKAEVEEEEEVMVAGRIS